MHFKFQLLPALLAFTALSHAQAVKPITARLIGRYVTDGPKVGGAEIPAYDPASKRLFVVNFGARVVDILDLSDPAKPAKAGTLNPAESFAGSVANSVAVAGGLVAVAVEAAVKTDPGQIQVYTPQGRLLRAFPAGALPDMVTFSPDGRKILSANEGEPNSDYSIDPEGSVTVVELAANRADLAAATSYTAGFGDFKKEDLDPKVRIYGPNATVAQDLEPEYIAVSPDRDKAFVTLQENNAVAVLDLAQKKFTAILPLGFKDHMRPGNSLDPSDRDNRVRIARWPVFGMYQPDGIAAFRDRGEVFLITANEGDAREYSTFAEEVRVGSNSVVLNPNIFPYARSLKDNASLGRLTVTNTLGRNGAGQYEALYVFGARSFTIWKSTGELVWDSGDEFERITAERYPLDFNSSNDANGTADTRSDNKGPEPEDVKVAELFGRRYAFIGLERIGGVMIYDITNPYLPSFVDYVNNRDFSTGGAANSDLGPEGLLVITPGDSPNGKPLLIVANEVSGSTSIFEIVQK